MFSSEFGGPLFETHEFKHPQSRISIAIIMAFIARGLASIPSQIFCYSAISSAGVVLVLPGYMICKQFFNVQHLNADDGASLVCSALELASKNIVTGSVKLT